MFHMMLQDRSNFLPNTCCFKQQSVVCVKITVTRDRKNFYSFPSGNTFSACLIFWVWVQISSVLLKNVIIFLSSPASHTALQYPRPFSVYSLPFYNCFLHELSFLLQISVSEEYEEKIYIPKRPNISLINSYRHTWKSRQNHYLRYSDVKPKDERRPTVTDLANQKQVLQKLNGWKVYHLSTQMEDLVSMKLLQIQ